MHLPKDPRLEPLFVKQKLSFSVGQDSEQYPHSPVFILSEASVSVAHHGALGNVVLLPLFSGSESVVQFQYNLLVQGLRNGNRQATPHLDPPTVIHFVSSLPSQ